jgi:hypothetical protein
MDNKELARKILSFMGYATTSPSNEPGADWHVDGITEILESAVTGEKFNLGLKARGFSPEQGRLESATDTSNLALKDEVLISVSQDHDTGCICKGSWRAIATKSLPLLDRMFRDSKGNDYIFYGIVLGSDDYYYGMSPIAGGNPTLLSCVCSIKGHGFTLLA